MAGGYRTPPGDGLGPIVERIRDIERKLRNLAKPSGTNMASLVKQVQALIVKVNETLEDIATVVEAEITAQSYTRTAIDNLVANPPGTVTVGGELIANTGMRSTGVYNMLLTYGGAYSSQYVHVDGTMGYVPSSRQFKQDIEAVTLDPAMLMALQLVTFRYIQAVENLGDEAQQEIGLIAEDVDALGLTWLVDYDAEGKPFGVKYERLALAFIPWAQSIESRLTAAGI